MTALAAWGVLCACATAGCVFHGEPCPPPCTPLFDVHTWCGTTGWARIYSEPDAGWKAAFSDVGREFSVALRDLAVNSQTPAADFRWDPTFSQSAHAGSFGSTAAARA